MSRPDRPRRRGPGVGGVSALVLLAVGTAGALTGCGESGGEVLDAGDVRVLVGQPVDSAMDALLTGRLTVVAGCLGVQQGEARSSAVVVIWPHGTTVVDAGAEPDELTIDLPGRGEIGLGDAVEVGGGGVDDATGAGVEVPESCRDAELWLASDS